MSHSRPTSVIVRFSQLNSVILSNLVSKSLQSSLPVVRLNQKKDQVVEAQLIPQGELLHYDEVIARYLVRLAASSGSKEALELLGGFDAVSQTLVDEWISKASRFSASDLSSLEAHLLHHTFLVTERLTLADVALYITFHQKKLLETPENEKYGQVHRWYKHLSTLSHFEVLKAVEEEAAASSKKKESQKNEAKKPSCGWQGSFLQLQGAEDGKVVTRFPPEPSGYLHIGHMKAALLNDFYARQYHGKMLLRFDDTNPSKEKEEYVENILRDLATLGIKPDKISCTSDYFDQIIEYAEQLIKMGKAYVDSSSREQIKAERMSGTESKYRNTTPEENFALWEEMKKGTEKGVQCVLRAKIDMQSKNKCLRDPAIYRCKIDPPHHKTGDKYKVYPCYDFACPIVDSIEGVTHALRSSEYHEHNALYEWPFPVLGIRPVKIEDFSRLNFKYTLLSKRKLQKFVDSKLVDGWYDPAFPTIQGIMRRGMTLDALREFILSQGASKSVTNMEMDKIWSINKQFIDPIIPRHTAIAKEDKCPVKINGVTKEETKEVLKHKKNPSLGNKTVAYKDSIWLEQEDAKDLQQGEEVTLMDWGNIIIKTVEKDDKGNAINVVADLHLEGDFKKTKKKLTWLADISDLVQVKLTEYFPLITKEKLDENDDFEKYINPQISKTTFAIGDPNLKSLAKGEKLQLERRGYFIVDVPYNKETNDSMTLILIPDGRQKDVYKRGS